jgi:uroporphyrinogen-III synthase
MLDANCDRAPRRACSRRSRDRVRILVTRPEPAASRTAGQLVQLGHEVLVDPLLTIELLNIGRVPAGEYAALAATSANAVRAAGATALFDRLRDVPLYAVGASTADAARAAGFRRVISADGDARALARLLTRELAAGVRVLHLAGEERAQDLAPLLAPAAIAVDVVVLYRMRAGRQFAHATLSALAGAKLGAALHFSARSSMTFAALAARHRLENEARFLKHYCLSPAVAAPLQAAGFSCEIAPHPDEAALLALLES